MLCVEGGGQSLKDFRIVPILRADIFANDVSGAIDDVRLRNLDCPVAVHDGLGRVADGEEIDVIRQQKISIRLRVLIDADPENLQLGKSMVKGQERRKLLHARGAPACPECEQHDLTAILAEAESLRAIVDGEGGGSLAEFARELAAVASGGESETRDQKT